MIRIETRAGHGAGRSTSGILCAGSIPPDAEPAQRRVTGGPIRGWTGRRGPGDPHWTWMFPPPMRNGPNLGLGTFGELQKASLAASVPRATIELMSE